MKKVHLPQSENEWLVSGRFEVKTKSILNNQIRLALVRAESSERSPTLVTMVGGIPRDDVRRKNLPLINKLYGNLALRLERQGISSLLYNQPGTGGSTGSWENETLLSRTKTLTELVTQIGNELGIYCHILIGTSAGAYMAVRSLAGIHVAGHQVEKLILLSPAAYPEGAEHLPYGENFRAELLKDWDKTKSPVFTDLSQFLVSGGKLMVSFFEDDDPPIPSVIQGLFLSLLKTHASKGYDVRHMIIEGVAHNFRYIFKKPNDSAVNNASIIKTTESILGFIT